MAIPQVPLSKKWGNFVTCQVYIATCFCFRELLSPQQHYDWGLRALKTVLRGCGSLLDQEKQHQGGKKGMFTLFINTILLS